MSFANVIAVRKWWYKPINMLVFPQYFSLNVHHFNDSIYNWNCCNQAQLFKQKNNHEMSYNWNFCMNFFKTPSSKNVIASVRIVTIERSELTSLLILHFHVKKCMRSNHFDDVIITLYSRVAIGSLSITSKIFL